MRWLSSVLLGLIIFNAWAAPEDTVQFYFDNYGRADSDDKLVRRVHKIFEQVKLVADKRHHRLPKLAIVEGFNAPDDPLAIALPDGHLVLSKKALEIIYKNASPRQGDTRAAFVLGHELAHLANDDFWHREFLSVTRDSQLLDKLIKNYRGKNGKEKEIASDDRGFIYAAMAGYPVDKLLAEDGQQQNFFVYWQQQTFQGVDKTHPHPDERAEVLRMRLKKLLEILPYFHFGVRLTHFNRCEDSLYFLREFLKNFPGREVYNNLGVCELQRARFELGTEAYLYWLPSVLDVTTPLEDLSLYDRNGRGERNSLAETLLKNAKEYFKLALDMEPSYVPANVNLAITALYLGEIYEARAAIEKVRKLAPLDLDIQGLRTVILYEEGEQSPYVDMWPYVIRQLENLAIEPNAPLSVHYNIARLLEKRRRTGADKIWQKLKLVAADLPEPYQSLVCEKTGCFLPPRKKSPKKTWALPVELGGDTGDNKTLRQWEKNDNVRLYDLHEEIYQHGSAEVLGLGEQVEMVVLKSLDNITKDDLGDYCGQSLRQRRVVNGTLWSCHNNWTALVVDEKVKEVWVVNKSMPSRAAKVGR